MTQQQPPVNVNNSSGNGIVALIVGLIVVALIAFGIYWFLTHNTSTTTTTTSPIPTLPAAPTALPTP